MSGTAPRQSFSLPGLRWRGFTVQLFLITVLPLTGLLLALVFTSQTLHHDAMRALVGERNLRAVRAAAGSLSEQLNQRSFNLLLLSRQLAAGDDLAAPRAAIQPLVAAFDGVAWYDRQGNLKSASMTAGWWRVLPFSHGAYWQTLQAAPPEQALFSPAMRTGLSQPLHVLIGLRLANGEVLCGAFLPEEALRTTLQALTANGRTTVVVADAQANILMHSGALPAAEMPAQHPGVEEALNGQSDVQYTPAGQHGEHVVAYSPVQPGGWALVLEETWEDISTPLLSTTQSAPLILVPVLLLAVAALGFGLRQIVQPLQKLERRAARLAEGDFAAIQEPAGGIAEIRHLQDELVAMAASLRAAQDSLREYIGAIHTREERERLNLARELHDDTLQALIALNQRLQLAQLEQAAPAERARLGELQQMVTQSMHNLRRMVRGLRPIYLEDLGLAAALEMLVKESRGTDGPEVQLQLEGEQRRLPGEVELALYRMTQEALHNAVRHAHARRVVVRLTGTSQQLELCVQDDGRGFITPAHPDHFARSGHFGVLGLYERAALIGARLKIDAQPGQGTTVTVALPVQPDDDGLPGSDT